MAQTIQTQRNPEEAGDKDRQALEYYRRARFLGSYGVLFGPQATLASWHLRMSLWRGVKRSIDCVLAFLLMVIASPIILACAIAIKLDSPGPVIFKQTRTGKWGQPFMFYKFRSMYIDADQRKAELMEQNEVAGLMFKMKRDPRVTRVGAIIRKLSIDELPQLVNVMRGDMCLVGPRPPLPVEVEYYAVEHMRRLEVTPGITGLAQVMGRSDLDFEGWVALDREYIAHRSIRSDVMILLKTVPAVLFGAEPTKNRLEVRAKTVQLVSIRLGSGGVACAIDVQRRGTAQCRSLSHLSATTK